MSCSDSSGSTSASPWSHSRFVVLALNFPMGPLAFGDAAGPATILKILRNIQRLTGDPRYRPTPWLRRRAELGVSLLTPEN